jgi:hypothetical protein
MPIQWLAQLARGWARHGRCGARFLPSQRHGTQLQHTAPACNLETVAPQRGRRLVGPRLQRSKRAHARSGHTPDKLKYCGCCIAGSTRQVAEQPGAVCFKTHWEAQDATAHSMSRGAAEPGQFRAHGGHRVSAPNWSHAFFPQKSKKATSRKNTWWMPAYKYTVQGNFCGHCAIPGCPTCRVRVPKHSISWSRPTPRIPLTLNATRSQAVS